jgi:hypothetical protein
MDGKFTVYFEDPFWVGVVEINDEGKIKIGKVIFGSEPSGADIYNFTKNEFHKIKFNETQTVDEKIIKNKINPKRMIKLARKEQEKKGIGTKSQLAIKKIQENKKNEITKTKKEKKIEAMEKKYQLKQMKKKKKKKGH